MMFAIDNDTVAAFRLGDLPATKVFLGDSLLYEMDPLTMTVEGTTFEPILELASGSTATLQWVDESGAVVGTGTTPTIVFPDATPRQVRLLVSRPGDVVTLNLGFHDRQDSGLYSLPESYNYPTQPVTAISNLQNLTGLERFMAARTNGSSADGNLYTGPVLSGALNFAGMTSLEYIECFQAGVESVTLTGCISLIRLCLEQCNLTALDLNPVRGTLRDLRLAVQQGGSLTLTELDGPLTNLYHFCTRGQVLSGFPGGEALPALRQLWVWRNGLVEDTVTIRSSADLHTVRLGFSGDSSLGPANQVTSLDLAGQTWGPLSGPQGLWAYGIGLESIDLTGMGAVGDVRLHGNALPTAMVDHVLSVVDGWGTSDGNLTLAGNAAPTDTTAVDALTGRGWTVTYEEPSTDPGDPDPPTGLLWEDAFDRADATGWAAVGSPWLQPLGGSDIDIASEALVLSGGSGYQRAWAMPPELDGITDYAVEIDMDQSSQDGYWYGILARMDATGAGTKVLVNAASNARMERADSASGANIALAVPAGWTDPGTHTLRAEFAGRVITIYMDGVLAGTGSSSGNDGTVGGGVGLCGESRGRAWQAVRVYALDG